MRRMGLYKHTRNTDVAMLVLNHIYTLETDSHKVKVSWINIVNPLNRYPCGVTETAEIKGEDILNWELIR